jgi:3',5'-cyclic AMP phosphodiesterase CpdA
VLRSKKTVSLFISFLLFIPSLLFSCNVDPLGFFASNNLDIRFDDHNTFHFLTANDRELLLPDEYSFLVLTDTHIKNGDAHGAERLAEVIGDAKFVVITGDITQYGGRADIQKFIEIAGTLGVPCYPVVGNHDIFFDNWHNWRDLIGSATYRIGAPGSGTTLFVLDTANAMFGKRQLDWLEKELKTASDRVFVFSHANLFTKDLGVTDMQQLTDVRERARVMSLLKGRVDAVFMGHIHKRIERESGGVQYITIEDFIRYKTYCRVFVTKEGIRRQFETL